MRKHLKRYTILRAASVGKLISGKQYLGGYAMEQQRGKAEAEGKELPYKQRKKLQTKDTAIPSTSGAGKKLNEFTEESRNSLRTCTKKKKKKKKKKRNLDKKNRRKSNADDEF